MEVVNNGYMSGDPRVIDHIVYELKSQGIFDNFRKECIADVDTKPAYQNLRQRVEGSVSGFLKTQRWRSDMNKNHVREMLRKNISESGFLETGVERIVDQVVNPKINSIFLPQVENVAYRVLGVQNPTAFDDLKKEEAAIQEKENKVDLLPNDLESVSPESEPLEKKVDTGTDQQKVQDKIDEDESPAFELIQENAPPLEENSIDSNLSGISGLASHDSNHSIENRPAPRETSNQDSQFSKQSSDDHLSTVLLEEQEIKVEFNEDSNMSKVSASKVADSNSKSVAVPDSNLLDKNGQNLSTNDKPEEEKGDEKHHDGKKSEKHHRSSHKHSSHKSKHDSKDHKSDKDRKSDRSKKDHKSNNSKERRDKDKDRKDRSQSGKDEKGSKDSKKHEHSSSNSKHSKDKKKSSESKDDKSKDSKSRDRNKGDSKSKHHSAKRSKDDVKSHSKQNGKTKTDSVDSTKNPSKEKKSDKTHKKEDRHSTDKKSDKHKNKKDLKKDKDDHYSLKEKKNHRRSTDRDSSDGHSGTQSSSGSFTDLTTSKLQKSSQESSLVSGSSSGDSGNSESTTAMHFNISSIPCVVNAEEHSKIIANVPHLKLIKPKFASNIYEAKRLMKIRRKLGKLEKKTQMGLMRQNNTLNSMRPTIKEKVNNCKEDISNVDTKQHKHVNNSKLNFKTHSDKIKDKENVTKVSNSIIFQDGVKEVQEKEMELQTSVISKESWDAIEAKLNAENILKVDYNSYVETTVTEDTPATDYCQKVEEKTEETGFRGFDTSEFMDAKRRIHAVHTIIEKHELELTKICNDVCVKNEFVSDREGLNRLPKIKTFDITSNNEIIFSPGRGVKRVANEHDVHNNNKVNKEVGDLFNERLNDFTKSKKPKLIDPSVNLDNFNLPLSPADSDKSYNSINEKKADTDGRSRRNRSINNQRYSSDDLYKPRLQFTSKRRTRSSTNMEVD
ncbi:hypothetical protein FQA39_LY01125 [Lamprigera yunnana]|nr:hypothetical protein FQA39_LY01125 [Lamprigera yunnana]